MIRQLERATDNTGKASIVNGGNIRSVRSSFPFFVSENNSDNAKDTAGPAKRVCQISEIFGNIVPPTIPTLERRRGRANVPGSPDTAPRQTPAAALLMIVTFTLHKTARDRATGLNSQIVVYMQLLKDAPLTLNKFVVIN